MEQNKYVAEVCKIGRGTLCCRYLIVGFDGFECAKLLTDGEVRTAEEIANHAIPYPGKTPKQFFDERAHMMIAQGDNCEGQPTEVLNEKP